LSAVAGLFVNNSRIEKGVEGRSGKGIEMGCLLKQIFWVGLTGIFGEASLQACADLTSAVKALCFMEQYIAAEEKIFLLCNFILVDWLSTSTNEFIIDQGMLLFYKRLF